MSQAPHPIDDHAQWASSLWMGGSSDWQLSDHAVMSLGLVGESIEVLGEALEGGSRESEMKELGDVIYYWCICCMWVGSRPSSFWPEAAPPPAKGPQKTRKIDAAQLLCVAAGKGSEAAKKIIRDGNGPEILREALAEVARRWIACCSDFGMDWIEVLRANREKLEGRKARGTLGGSGNER